MDVPLLPRRHFCIQRASGVGENSSRYSLHQIQCVFRHWWALTTDEEYLGSSIGNRGVARVFIAFFSIFVAIIDCYVGYIKFPWMLCTWNLHDDALSYWEWAMVLLVLATSKLSIRSLKYDFSIAITIALWIGGYILFGPAEDAEAVIQSYLTVLMCFTLTGIHTCAVLANVVITVTCGCFSNYFAFSAVTLLVSGLTSAAVNGFVSHRCAMMLAQLKSQMFATEQVLDHATNGFCRIEKESGTIIEASSKMESMFSHVGGLPTSALQDFLPHRSDREDLQKLLSNGHDFRPILVTCDTRRGEQFDARLIPFRTSKEEASVCMQVIGEKRWVNRVEHAEIHKVAIVEDGALELDALSCFGTLSYSKSSQNRQEKTPAEIRSIGSQTHDREFWMLPPKQPSWSHAARQVKKKRKSALKAPDVGKLRVRQFAPTPEATLVVMIEGILNGCNFCGAGCCEWHDSLAALHRFFKKLIAEPCKRNFQAHTDWQCKSCLALNDEYDDEDEDGGFICFVCENPSHCSKNLGSDVEETSGDSSQLKQHGPASEGGCEGDSEVTSEGLKAVSVVA